MLVGDDLVFFLMFGDAFCGDVSTVSVQGKSWTCFEFAKDGGSKGVHGVDADL